MVVEVRVLGPLEVILDGAPIAIAGGKERALVVTLALSAGRVVSRDRLIGALWGDDPPASADGSLRVLASRVRKAAPIVETRRPGYALRSDRVDVVEFRGLARDGRAELQGGRPEVAATILTSALALWRGEHLAERSTDDLRAASTALEELRLSTVEARIEAELACGQHADVLPELADLCALHPWRERLWALRMTALYRSQRQAEALACYHDVRRVLAEELGLDPSPELRQLELAVLSQDPELAAPAPPAGRSIPLPEPFAVVERVPLVGRSGELESARAMVSAASRGASGVLVVRGEAGIGKTRLLREVAREAPGIVLYGRCDEDLAIPYRPYVEGLGHALAHLPDDALASLRADQLAELARVLPGVLDRWPGASRPAPALPPAAVERYALFGAVAALLGAVARQEPLLVILDDLHWADRPSLLLTAHLAGVRLPGVLLLIALRDPPAPAGPLVELLGSLARLGGVTSIDPRHLSADDTRALLAATAGSAAAADDGLVGLLHRETQGNPFYLVEMARHARETGAIGPGGAAHALPDSIRDVVRARVNRLGDQPYRLLAVAAVIGEEFDADLVAESAGVDYEHVLDALDAAVRAGLVREAGRGYRFSHGLVQHTLYGDTSPPQRTRLHGRVAAAMERSADRQPGELAFHSLAGMTRQTTEKAIDAARAAGWWALESAAPDEAVRWFSAALNAMPPPRCGPRYARALIDLGTAQRLAGQPAFRETILRAARVAEQAGDHDLFIAAALASNRGSFSKLGETDTEKVALIEQALAVAAPESPARVELLADLACELTYDPDYQRRLEIADEALALARRIGDPALVMLAILRPGPARMIPDQAEVRAALYREAFELAEQSGLVAGVNPATTLLATTLLECGRPDDMAERLDAAVQETNQLGEPFLRWVTRFVRACMTIAHGPLDLAELHVADAARVAEADRLPEAQTAHDDQLFVIRWQQGRLDEMLARLREVGDLVPAAANRKAELALAEALCGESDAARTALNDAAATGFAVPYAAPWLGAMCLWADVAAELAERSAAELLARALSPHEDLFAMSGPLPFHAVALSLARLATVLGRSDEAERLFRVALRVHDSVGAPFGAAVAAALLGTMLRDRAPAEAEGLLSRADELSERQGLGGVRLHRELQWRY